MARNASDQFMPIGSSSLRDNRRRRALLEDKQEVVEPTNLPRKKTRTDASSSAMSERTYTDAALVDNHPQISSLIPKKIWLIGIIVLALTAAIVLLNLLNGYSHLWAEKYGAQLVTAFDMHAGRGLVKWLSSFLLVVAALYCLQIYLIRRHRNDDYRGTYRLWIWLAGLLLLTSVEATAGLHEFVITVSSEFVRQHLHFTSKSALLLIFLVPPVCFAARVLVEIRLSKGAVAAFVLASVSFCFAFLLRMKFFATAPHVEDVLHCNSLLVGYMSLFLSTACFARFVFLDSQGILIEMARKQAERLAAKEARRKELEEVRATKMKEKEKQQAEKAAAKEASAQRSPSVKKKSEKSTPQTTANHPATDSQKESQQATSEKNQAASKPSPLAARVSSSKSKTKSTADSSRQVPEFQKTSKSNSQNGETQSGGEERSTISLEEIQRQMNETKSRSERKRLQKMMKREQRRAA